MGDGEAAVRDVLRRGLERAGYQVDVCSDGLEVWRLYRPGTYDLLVLEASLSRRAGIEVVARVRDRGDDVPILLMAADAQGARRAAAFAFTYRLELLEKPFGWADLRRAVERVTRRSVP